MSRLPRGLLGMLLIVAVVERWVSARYLDYTDPASLGWRTSVEAAGVEAVGADVLCLGDSLAKHGLLPAVISAQTGRSSYNLAAPAAPAAMTYLTLTRALDAGARPRAIVVDFAPDLLAGGPTYQERSWPEVLTAREAASLAIDARGSRLLAKVVLGRWLATCRGRFELRAAILGHLAGRPPTLGIANRAMVENWQRDLGANRVGPAPGFNGEVSEADHRRLMDHAFRAHRVNALYVDRLLRLADRRGIAVRWLIPPVSPTVQARRDASGADAAYTDFVRRSICDHRHVAVVDARRMGLDAGSFVDPIHLGGAGAEALSAAVAERLGDSATAWVLLGPTARSSVARSSATRSDARKRR